FFIFVYTAQKDLNDRATIEGYKPTTYNTKGEFKYESLPIKSKNPIDNIFLSLVFPAYNEEKRLSPALEKAVNYFSSLGIKYEIIIVNDGSKDKTFDLIQNEIKKYSSFQYLTNKPEIIMVNYKKNGGKGYAVRTGMQYIRGKYTLMIDSDGATDIKDYESLYKTIENEEYALAIGSRKIITEQVERVWYRNIIGIINNIFIKVLIGIKDIKDTQCGFKLFTRKAAIDLFTNLHLVRWAFDVDLLYISQKLKIKVIEVPVNWKEIPGSKLVLLPATISFFRDYFAKVFQNGNLSKTRRKRISLKDSDLG
ncbi:MAG: glycosyltransferase, partial [Bacilli bacterium]|nr:glycosyltransferase [Bacilli bacterium]